MENKDNIGILSGTDANNEEKMSPVEVSRRLRATVNPDLLYDRISRHIPELIQKYLSSSKLLKDNGDTVDILPDGFDMEAADRIVLEMRGVVEREYSYEEHLPALFNLVKDLTDKEGETHMAVCLKQFRQDMEKRSRHYADIQRPDFKRKELYRKYEAAKRITVRERIMQDNDKDVTDFVDSLTLYCRELCEVEVSLALARLYHDIATTPRLTALIAD